MDGRYVSRDTESFVKQEIWPEITRVLKFVLNERYDNQVMQNDGSMKQRLVPNKTIVDDLLTDATKEKVIAAIVPLIDYAQACEHAGCKDVA